MSHLHCRYFPGMSRSGLYQLRFLTRPSKCAICQENDAESQKRNRCAQFESGHQGGDGWMYWHSIFQSSSVFFWRGQKWKFARVPCWRRRGVEGHEGWILNLNLWCIVRSYFMCPFGQATIGNAEFSDAKILENLKFFVGTWVWTEVTSGTGLIFICLWIRIVYW